MYSYNGKERSLARKQGLVSALLTMAVLTSLGAGNKVATGVFSALLFAAHLSHFWYFAIKTTLGSPRELYEILTGPYRPCFGPLLSLLRTQPGLRPTPFYFGSPTRPS